MELVFDGQWQKWVNPGLFDVWNTNCLGFYHIGITLLFLQKAPNYLLWFSAHLCLFTYSTFSKHLQWIDIQGVLGGRNRWLLVCHEGTLLGEQVAQLRSSLQLTPVTTFTLVLTGITGLAATASCMGGRSNQLNIVKRFNTYSALFWKLFKQ